VSATHTPTAWDPALLGEVHPGACDDVVARLHGEHPDWPVVRVADLLAAALRGTTDARVQAFRLVLAERRVRDELRCSAPPREQRSAEPAAAAA
jgi:hypothetical protein